ncbi:hypothetical protein [Natronocalculus amylovorans]|uniref:DUF8160 domain-containing protein n=1 Tax=Natronocalculus amylovorans TaxID=2917812 RepID=A0AAE3K9T2_9EURY|nr:hypothetical protein [Natronocalculus amylovorans]MCL9818353.1 hypothetical protein [Natronocalculus amylovorans]
MSDDNESKSRRANALRDRIKSPSETAETENTSETSKTAETAETEKHTDVAETEERSKTAKKPKKSKTSKTAKNKTGGSVKDRKNVNMYLPESVINEMGIRFDELNARHKREHGRGMEKNRDFYPALIEAALSDTTIEEELGLE